MAYFSKLVVRHLLDGGSLFSSPSPPFPSFNGADIEDSTSPEEYSLFLLLKYIVFFYEYLVRQICFITSLVSAERQAATSHNYFLFRATHKLFSLNTAMSHHYFLFRTTTLDSSGQNYFFNDIFKAFKV